MSAWERFAAAALLIGLPLGLALDALIGAVLWHRRGVILMTLRRYRAQLIAAVLGAAAGLVAVGVLASTLTLHMSL